MRSLQRALIPDGSVVLSGVVTIPAAVSELAPWIESTRRARSTSRLREFVVGPENALLRHAITRMLNSASESRTRFAEQPLFALEAQQELEAELAFVYPLVLVGPTGSGKTHLVNMLSDAWSHDRAAAEVVRFAAIDYAREFRDANAQRSLAWWRSQQRNAALLVIEEVGVLSEHFAAQVELINTLDERRELSLPTVITSRRPIDAALDLQSELLSRLEEGALVTIEPPRSETRFELVSRLAKTRKMPISAAALRQLAEGLSGQAQDLFGVLLQIEAVAQVEKRSIHLDDVKQALNRSQVAAAPTLREIALATARRLDVSLTEMRSATRRQAVVHARGVAMYLARSLTGLSLTQIGEFFGRRDHTTVLHACRKTEADQDPVLQQAMRDIRQTLTHATTHHSR